MSLKLCSQVVARNESSVSPGIDFSAGLRNCSGSAGHGYGASVPGAHYITPDYTSTNVLSFGSVRLGQRSGADAAKHSLLHQPATIGASTIGNNNNSERANPVCASEFEDEQSTSMNTMENNGSTDGFNNPMASLDIFKNFGELLLELELITWWQIMP